MDDQSGPGRMVDSCAIQVPQKIEKDAPAPQMGEAGRGVEITMWRADWQAYVNGRGDTIRDIYPNAAVDHYPFDANSLASQARRSRPRWRSDIHPQLHSEIVALVPGKRRSRTCGQRTGLAQSKRVRKLYRTW